MHPKLFGLHYRVRVHTWTLNIDCFCAVNCIHCHGQPEAEWALDGWMDYADHDVGQSVYTV